MSGIDEQNLENCPLCNELPPYWVLGDKGSGGLVWIYTENYPWSRKRNTIEFREFNPPRKLGDMEQHIGYLWCGGCNKRSKNKPLINILFRRAKKLEEEGRVDIS